VWNLAFVLLLLQAPVAPPPDALTELDRVRIENAELWDRLTTAYAEGDVCRADLAPYRKAENAAALQRLKAKLKADLEAAHPCCTYDEATRRLVPKTSH
jgi:hypothetical protein